MQLTCCRMFVNIEVPSHIFLLGTSCIEAIIGKPYKDSKYISLVR